MSASTLNSSTYNTVAANTVDDAVIDAPSILSWRQNVKAVVDQHAAEIDLKWDNTNSPKSLAANGYQKLASGLILQWGIKTLAGGTSAAVTLPISFPIINLGVWAQAETADTTINPETGSYLVNQFNIWINGTGTQTIHWFAIGY